ncbi:6,7-dimethyl-8-ribityllumazine synthase [Govanella unica]|uniref:6,7-dimethyl-8-ribityllumazine synthase n=1 Tax=Govanella unica TaxID=2975056 RepID=A0A9X3Z7K9_9PROT|nr:6,7-dimethyl-8-ribityllumazine synthase [Govania unica]MDA5194089.1 6,7-dimethyl-8-ribityllumazine synthase [Govania unica]
MTEKPHFLIVEARFYEELADELMRGAAGALAEAGATYDRVSVPGALEIPGVIRFALDGMAEGGTHYDGFVALGTVIRGETYHFEIVSNESSRGLQNLAVLEGAAIGNGILTVENDDQAWVRARVSDKNKGGDAARAALVMVAMRHRFVGNV